MAERYSFGSNRIFYRSASFKEGLQVSVDLLSPNLIVHKGISLVEVGSGIYYFDYDFLQEGVWVGIFYENGVKKTSQNFLIERNKESSGLHQSSSSGEWLINR
ncbi:MAG: hypothetical protein ACTSUO_08500 [Candidatus Thorarchaeota archaeon]